MGPTASPLTAFAVPYRRERVAYDHIRAEFDANEDAASESTLEAALLASFDRCQRLARSVADVVPGTDDERIERCAVRLDAGLMADRPFAEMLAILAEVAETSMPAG